MPRQGDTFDLVPIGAYHGRGRRAGGFGAFLLAVYEPTSGRFQPICKLGSGLSDEALERCSAMAEAQTCDADLVAELLDLPEALPPSVAPHVWLRPSVVWEVSAAEVSLSPVYRAAYGAVATGRGLALRFPRLLRERPDKQPTDATTAAQLASVYQTQPTATLPSAPATSDKDPSA